MLLNSFNFPPFFFTSFPFFSTLLLLFEQFVPRLPRQHERVHPEGEHEYDNDDLLGRDLGQHRGIWDQGLVNAESVRVRSQHDQVGSGVRDVVTVQGFVEGRCRSTERRR